MNRAIALTTALVFSLAAGSASAQEVAIGAPMALSGPLASVGQRALNGLQMAVEELNASGGLLGSKIRLVTGDDAATPATANTITRNMVLNDRVKAIFGGSSSATVAVEETIAGQYKLPMMIYAGNDISLTTTNFNDFAFQMQPSTFMEPRAVALYLARANLKRVFTISPDFSFGHSYVKNFLEGLRENGVQPDVVGEQYPALGSSDFSTYIAAALAAKPDFVFVGLFSGDLVTFIKQAKGYGLFDRVAVGVSTATDTVLTLKGETPANVTMWGRAPFFAMNAPGIQDFAKRHHQKHGSWPSDWPVLAYASIQIWAEAVRKAGTFDGPKVAAVLNGGKFTSILGDLTFRECDHQADAPVYIGKASKAVDARYGFPLLEDITIVDPNKTMMSCEQARSLQKK
jgi:branched-chain amino acid transport system substrate-binding protein